jgi:hypothetical protein
MTTAPSSLIINSAFTEPAQHWAENLDRTLRLEAVRRPAGYEIIDTRENTRRMVTIPLVDDIRDRVRQWRGDGWPGTTAITQTLLQHWWDADKVSTPSVPVLLLPTGGDGNADLARWRHRPNTAKASYSRRWWRRSSGCATRWPPAAARPR